MFRAAVTEQIRGWNIAVHGCEASAGTCEDEPPGDYLGRARNVVGEPGVQAKLETVTPRVPVTGLVAPPGTLGQSHLIQGREYWGCVYVLKKKIQGLMVVCLVILAI